MSYDGLVGQVRIFRLEHKDLSDDALDKLILRRFRISRSVLREIDGISYFLDSLD